MTTYLTQAASVLVCLLLLLQRSSAQLASRIISPANKYIYTVEISNPTDTTISLLAWNNIFDPVTKLPVLFEVRDDQQGSVVPLASSNVMRASMSSKDFYYLAPGESFSRTIDIRQIMQNLPSGPSMPQGAGLGDKIFIITTPAAYKGVIGDASAVVAALADLDSSPKSLGDLGTSNLQDITVAATTERFSNIFPLFREADSTYFSPADGIHASTECAVQDFADVSNAIFDAGLYASSLAKAADDSTNTLFPRFFSPSAYDRHLVSTVAAAAAAGLTQGKGPHVDVYCQDIQGLCTNSNFLGYSFTPSFLGDAYIVLCPAARALGRAPAPCERGSVGGASTSHVLFHLLMTLNNVVPMVATSLVNGLLACQNLAGSTLIQPTRNPDSLAQLAIAQWGYGLGGAPYNGASCLPADGTPISPITRKRATSSRQRREWNPNKDSRRAPRHTSPQGLSRRQSTGYPALDEDLARTSDCTPAESSMLQLALENARAMARSASEDLSSTTTESSERWTAYFNGDSKIKRQVKANFDKVAKWNPQGSNVRFRCDRFRRSHFCLGSQIQAVVQNYVYPKYQPKLLITCNPYFYNAISLQCLNPESLPNFLYDHQRDQGGIMLHELLHITSTRDWTTTIADGNPACSNWHCLQQNAHDRVLPSFQQANLPEVVATSYEFYAYDVRAARQECSWTEYAGAMSGAIFG
ncbi:MAG: hypothetical protein Q9183_001955 [Haloplaca sp. 2 TL-2023]